MDIIKSSDFYQDLHSEVFNMMVDMHSRRIAIDPVTLTEQLKAKTICTDAEISSFLRQLMDITPTARNVKKYAEIVRNESRLRAIRQLIASVSDETDAEVCISKAMDGLYSLSKTGEADRGMASISDALYEFEQQYENKSDDGRIDTGFEKLDGLLKGLMPGNLVVVAARPGVGKSAFAMDLAYGMSYRGKNGFLFSLEMDKTEIVERWIAKETWSKMDDIIDKKVPIENIIPKAEKMAQLPIYINDNSSISVNDIRRSCQTKRDVEFIVIDYLQLMKSTGKYANRNLEVGAMTRELKILAKDLHIPIILLSQLRRPDNGKEDNEPVLSELRDSGEIEQHINKAIMMWVLGVDADGIQTIGVKVAKNRRGRRGIVQMKFDGAHMCYAEIEARYELPEQTKPKAYKGME